MKELPLTKGQIALVERDRFKAEIRVNYKLIRLGHFKDEIEAAKAYDEAAKKHFGEFAKTNFDL